MFKEIAFVRTTVLSPRQVAGISDSLLREFETNSQDNSYLLRQIARGYEDADPVEVAAATGLPKYIVALTSDALRRAAELYLKTDSYVQVTLMSGKK